MTSARISFRASVAFAFFAASAPWAWGQSLDIPSAVTEAHGPNSWVSAQYVRSEQNGGARIFEKDYDPARILGLQTAFRFWPKST